MIAKLVRSSRNCKSIKTSKIYIIRIKKRPFFMPVSELIKPDKDIDSFVSYQETSFPESNFIFPFMSFRIPLMYSQKSTCFPTVVLFKSTRKQKLTSLTSPYLLCFLVRDLFCCSQRVVSFFQQKDLAAEGNMMGCFYKPVDFGVISFS